MLILLFLLGTDSLSLDQTIDIALKRSPGYLGAITELRRVRYEYHYNLTGFLPSISAEIGYSDHKSQGLETNGYSGALTLSQPILDLDLVSGILAARNSLKGSEIAELRSQADLILRTTLAYYAVVESNYLIRSARSALSRAKENERYLLERYELGAASRLERLEAETFRLKAEQELVRAENAKALSQEELSSILDLDSEIVPTDTFSMPLDTVLPALDSLLNLLPSTNYDLRLIAAQARTAKANLTKSYLSFLPRVGLYYRFEYLGPEYPKEPSELEEISTTSFGISIGLPIFELRNLYFNNRRAVTEYELIGYKRRQLELEVEKELIATYYSLAGALKRLAYAQRALSSAEATVELAREQYRLGAASVLDLLTNESNLYSAQFSYITSLKDYYAQRARLTYLLAMEG